MRFLVTFAMLALLISGCSSFFGGKKRSIELAEDAYVTTPGGKPRLRKKGEVVVVGVRESVFLESPGHIGVLVIGDDGSASLNKVAPKSADEWLGTVIQKRLNMSLGEIVGEMNQAQMLLATRKAPEALSRVQALEKKYPEIVQLQLLEASCHVVLGDKARAVTVLAEALKAEPENEAANELYQSLQGTAGKQQRAPASDKPAKRRKGRSR